MKTSVNVASQCRDLIDKIKAGEFSPIYLLMGDEPYYLDMVAGAVIENALDEFSRDFNETICYGADVDSDTVITAARRFPMMAARSVNASERNITFRGRSIAFASGVAGCPRNFGSDAARFQRSSASAAVPNHNIRTIQEKLTTIMARPKGLVEAKR